MKRLLPVGAAIAALAVATLFALSGTGGSPAATSTPSAEASDSPTPVPSATASPEPTPGLFIPVPDDTPAPVPSTWTPPPGYIGTLRYGNWVTITGTDSCLNVRAYAGLVQPGPEGTIEVPKLNCLPDGFIGQLSFGPNFDFSYGQQVPVQADGHWWWNILGQGWVAEDWLTFLSEESVSPYPVRPELAGKGLVAFVRADGVWVAGADGSFPHLVYSVSSDSTVYSLRWSPDGQFLAVGRTIPNDSSWVTDVIDTSGTLVEEYPGFSEATFSPDGAWLAGLSNSLPGGLGGYQAMPAVINRSTGAVTAVGPAGLFSLQGPQWSPDGQSVTLVCVSFVNTIWQPDGTYIEEPVDCGADGLQVVSLIDGSKRVIAPASNEGGPYYWAPSFSPNGSTIAVYEYNGGCEGYSVIDVTSGVRQQCFTLPAYGNFGGRCGGDSESGASDWSPDGTILAYHWQFREGQNGVALVDVATGDRRMILTGGASGVNFSSDSQHLVFESAGYIWTADSDATNVTRMTEGRLPAWQPVH